MLSPERTLSESSVFELDWTSRSCTNVIRLHTFPDARSWVNIAPTFIDTEAAEEMKGRIEFIAVDSSSRIFTEYYLVERPFFNVRRSTTLSWSCMKLVILALYRDAKPCH